MVSIIAISVVVSTFLAASLYWIIVSVSRIYRFKKYRRVAAKHLSPQEESGNIFEQCCYHYETEIHKYVYFILINLTEVCVGVMVLIYTLAYDNYIIFSEIESSQKVILSNCSSVDSLSLKEFQPKQSLLFRNGIAALLNIAELIITILGVSLMGYLTRRIKQIQYPPNRVKIGVSILSIILISSIIIVTACVPNLLLINKIVFPFALLICFSILLRTVKQFERTLLQRAGERLAQFGSNKEEYQEYKHFKITMRIIFFGFMLIVMATYIIKLPSILTSILFYQKCQFPFNFLPHYNPILVTPENIEILMSIIYYMIVLGDWVALFGVMVTVSPFICVTVSIWINRIYKSISGKFKVKYRYHGTQFNEPLLKI